VGKGLREVLDGKRDHFSVQYPCHSPTQQRWFHLQATPLSGTPPQGALVQHVDVTSTMLRLERLSQWAEQVHAMGIEGLPEVQG